MGDKWRLYLGDRQILWGKNEFPSRLMAVFREHDKVVHGEWAQAVDKLNQTTLDEEDWPEHLDEIADRASRTGATLFGYRTTVQIALTRLRLMGFDAYSSTRSMAEIRRSQLRRDGEDENVLYARPARGVQGVPHQMTPEEVVETGLNSYVNACSHHGLDLRILEDIEWSCVDDLEFYFEDDSEDPRFLLSALLYGQDPNGSLTMDLSDLLAAGYCRSADALSDQAVQDLSFATANTGPIIVITEGKFDSRVLPRAMQLVRPDVAGYFRFWDIENSKAAGGTDQVVRNLRSFAAAGVMNRVIGLLDNDTAGRQAEKQLASGPLPDHYFICRLPELDFAREYPTLGPSGVAQDDVNGRACSVEFYFGERCLKGQDGYLIPVRWKSYIEGMSEYQGEISEKSVVQGRIEQMLRDVESGEKRLDEEWNAMRTLVQTLVDIANPDPDFPEPLEPDGVAG
ncbi:hypothetical protein AB0I35_23100 [Nocardia sp. NPDC050378]|uniref:hypothetical protein n=1 Tax=Nocardia sp. NPDC050378 TaxID=3155400 RepID=UPI003408C923